MANFYVPWCAVWKSIQHAADGILGSADPGFPQRERGGTYSFLNGVPGTYGMECGQLGQAKFSLLEFVIFKINYLNLACPHTKCMEPTGVTRSCNSCFPQDPSRKSRIHTRQDVLCMLYRYPNGTWRDKKVCHTKLQNSRGTASKNLL